MSTNRYIDKLKARLAKEADQRMQLQALLDDQVARNRALLAERDALLDERDRPTRASADVLAERRRQVEREGWTPAHDDLYSAAELPRAAAAYVLNGANDKAPCIWPFHAKWWKPRDARANYVRAAALLLAEIERIDRASLQGAQP